MNKKTKISYLWAYFSNKDIEKKVASCDICGQLLNYKTTVSNLRKHLETRHPSVPLPIRVRKVKSQAKNVQRPRPSGDDAAIQPCPDTNIPTVAEAEPPTCADNPQDNTLPLNKMNKNTKTGYLWFYFTNVDIEKKVAFCNICGHLLNYKTTVANLRKHLKTRHPSVSLPIQGNKFKSQVKNVQQPHRPSGVPAIQQGSDTNIPTVAEAEPPTCADTPQGNTLHLLNKMNNKTKTSYLWSHFSNKDIEKKIASCNICGHLLNYQTTVTNLRKHLERRHPSVTLPTKELKCQVNIVVQGSQSSNFPAIQPGTDTSTIAEAEPSVKRADTPHAGQGTPHVLNKSHTNLSSCLPVNKKNRETQKRKLDKLLLQLFIYDFQPFSIVEDQGFTNFVSGLNPSYKLPDRKTITNIMIPDEYERCVNTVRQELSTVDSVCLSTECCTSPNMESFLRVTAHYITENFELRSTELACSLLTSSQTSTDLAEAIKSVIVQFHLNDKILAVVSANASDIIEAIPNHPKIDHFGCFTHTLNLICQKALEIPDELLAKVKTIVSHFKESLTGLQQMTSSQETMGLEPTKIKQEVSTRWTSTFYLLERFYELKDETKTTLALSNKESLPVLTEEEWRICSELITVLEPFEEVTKKISGEKYMPGSLVIPLTNGLKSIYEKMQKDTYCAVAKCVVDNLLKGLNNNFLNIESNKTLALATFLDPRFKLVPFTSESEADFIKQHCYSLVADIWNEQQKKPKESVDDKNRTSEGQEQEFISSEEHKKKKYSIWENLENKIASKNVSGSKTSVAMIEINRYIEEGFLEREKDPFLWWRENQCYYPLLAILVKRKFNLIGSSVSCESLFSKEDNIVTERRSRLKAEDIEKLLFLNANLF